VDGMARFYLDKKTVGRVLVSVKGGKTINPGFVRDLIGTVDSQKAQMGVLITMAAPSRGITDAANHGGTYTWRVNWQSYPRIQVITVTDLLVGKRADMPPPILPYIQAARATLPAPRADDPGRRDGSGALSHSPDSTTPGEHHNSPGVARYVHRDSTGAGPAGAAYRLPTQPELPSRCLAWPGGASYARSRAFIGGYEPPEEI
jgi:hypothetical protein